MLTFPEIDPVIVQIGPLAIRWYGLMYLLGFSGGYVYLNYLVRFRDFSLSKDDVGDLVFNCVIGVVLGGRLGYTLFYNFSYFTQNPMKIFAVWEGGMSFHGGFIGVCVAAIFFCWRRNFSPLMIGDLLAAATPIGLFFGRVGNFINAELWGRTTTLPWGMVFPGGGPHSRHPSQIYEAVLEGIVLFVVLWWCHYRRMPAGVTCFGFLLGYGICRFVVEFVREPDAHLGVLAVGMSMGQWLSLPMILVGIVGVVFAFKRGPVK